MTDEMQFVLAVSAIILMWRDIALMWMKQEVDE
jgi:hypothetical protein